MLFPLQVIPVIDLQRGIVVRGIGGRRHEYQPVGSKLAGSAEPAAIGRALAGLGFETVYVADLDAIAGAEPAWPIYEQLSNCGLRLWLDAGISNLARLRALAGFNSLVPLAGIIAGLESLPDWDLLPAVLSAIGPERLLFSLDLAAGQPLTRWRDDPPCTAESIAARAVACGVSQMIVLDLSRVGSAAGAGDLDLCRTIHARWPQVRLISGGGVRSESDLATLASAGCQAALVASALYDGQLIADPRP